MKKFFFENWGQMLAGMGVGLLCALFIASEIDMRRDMRESHRVPDQCVRPVLFQQCMLSLPKGPASITAAGNDWDEVVKACESSAYNQSLRREATIKPECQ